MSTNSTPKPRAVDTAGIGPKFGRARRWAIGLTVAGAIGCLSSVIAWGALANMYLDRQDQLLPSLGRIEEVRSPDEAQDEVDVSFTWAGKPTTATIDVSRGGEWHAGETVTVLSSEDGSFVTLPGENYMPDWVTLVMFLALGTSAAVCIGGAIWWVRSRRKLVRASASTWHTVVAYFADGRGEDDKKTIFYLPDFAVDRLWTTTDRLPMLPARVQVAGGPGGIVLRAGEDDKLVLAKPDAVRPAQRVPVLAFARDGVDVAFRLELGTSTRILAGRVRDLPADVGDLSGVRTATVRRGRYGVALVQLGQSERPSAFRQISASHARKRFPQLVDGW